MTPVLEAREVSVSFGGVQALIDVDVRVEPGQLVGLIGPNGAGKTTFVDAISGFVGYRAASCSTAASCRACRRTRGHGSASRARGSRSSCSTT
jgi:ABC-type branched-subunit amino acid transport system ATPase component